MVAGQVQRILEDLRALDGADLDDVERIELIGALERVKGVAAAAQARVTVAFADSQLAAAGGSRRDQASARRSVGSQVALARRVSPSLGDRYVGLARALVEEMPATMDALREGVIGERATVEVAAATAAVDVDVRRAVDRRLRPDLGRLSVPQLGRAARRFVAELDAAAVVTAHERAVASRRVTVRPAPDGMAYLTVLGPLHEAVGAYASLRAHASSVAAGQGPEGESLGGRSAGAVMADAALRRLSGRALGEGQPVAVQLVMTDRTLTGIGDPDRSVMEPARMVGLGPVAAPTARAWLRPLEPEPDHHDGDHDAIRADAQVWVRRTFTSPDGRDLVALESRSELFPPVLRELLVLRDDTCRTPYCDALVAHADHISPRARGGPTTIGNGQGTCVRCNLTKEAPGWHHGTVAGAHTGQGPHEVVITTPTRHRYPSTAPPLLGLGWSPPSVAVEDALADDWLEVSWPQIADEHPDWFPELSPAA